MRMQTEGSKSLTQASQGPRPACVGAAVRLSVALRARRFGEGTFPPTAHRRRRRCVRVECPLFFFCCLFAGPNSRHMRTFLHMRGRTPLRKRRPTMARRYNGAMARRPQRQIALPPRQAPLINTPTAASTSSLRRPYPFASAHSSQACVLPHAQIDWSDAPLSFVYSSIQHPAPRGYRHASIGAVGKVDDPFLS